MTTQVGDAAVLAHQTAPAAPKLSDVLFSKSVRSFTSLAVLPSNVQAVDAAHLFANGIQQFVAIVGPSGWGKTHLISAASNRLHDFGAKTERLNAVEYALSSTPDRTSILFLDNAQDALEGAKCRQLLRLKLERRVKAGKSTLLCFTAAKPCRQIRSLLPSPRDWNVAAIQTPTANERLLVIGQISEAEKIQINHQLAKLLSSKMRGNGRTLEGALKRLTVYGQEWMDARATLRACGLLDPFFADNSAWDLKEEIARVSQHRDFRDPTGNDLAVFTMLREACLSEASVAHFMQMEPGEAYSRASRFEEIASQSETARARLNAFIEAVVDHLVRE